MIVTISNQHGTGAIGLAERAALVLGYAFVDRELPTVVARRMQVAPETVDAAEESEPSMAARLLSGFERSTPEVANAQADDRFEGDLVNALRAAVLEYAARGNVVIVGRGGGAILGRRDDVLRAYLYAPREWRIRHLMNAAGVGERIAAVEVDRVDRARRAFLKQRFGTDFGNPDAYDLCLDTSAFTEDRCVAILAAAVRARE